MRRLAYYAVAVALIGYSIFPVFWLVASAFKSTAAIISAPSTLMPSVPTVSNFQRLLHDERFISAVYSSLAVAVPISLAAVLVSLLLALTLRSKPTMLLVWFDKGFLLAYLLPPILIAFPMFLLFSALGLSDSLWGLGLAHLCYVFPVAHWLIRTRVLEMPGTLDESLMLEGAGFVDLVFWCWLPQLRQHLIAVGVLCFTISMGDYVIARFVLVSSQQTLPLAVQNIIEFSNKDWGLVCAAGTLAITAITVPALFFLYLSGRYYSGGLRG